METSFARVCPHWVSPSFLLCCSSHGVELATTLARYYKARAPPANIASGDLPKVSIWKFPNCKQTNWQNWRLAPKPVIRRQEVGLPGGKFSSQDIGRHDRLPDEIVPNCGSACITQDGAIMPQHFIRHLLRNLREYVILVVTGNQVSVHVNGRGGTGSAPYKIPRGLECRNACQVTLIFSKFWRS